jgi:hypothetical protein
LNEIIYSAAGEFTEEHVEYSIVVIGETPYAEGEGDRSDLTVSKEQINLVKKMKSMSDKVIVVIYSGRPLIINPILHYADAVIAAWLPGTEGLGITDILFGEYNPSGLLSMTWPKSMEQVPINIGDADYFPMYEFGFGITSLADSEFGSPPVYMSSIVKENGQEIEITFNKSMNNPSNSSADFVIIKNGSVITGGYSMSLKESDSTTIILALEDQFTGGDIVTIAYSGGDLSSRDGGLLEDFSSKEVYNEYREPAVVIPGHIEAENYTDMFGIQTESTTDEGGGLNVGWIDDGDWMEYRIDPEFSGIFMMSLRVASQSDAGTINVTSNSKTLFSRTLPVTGGWQVWTTVSQVIGLERGDQTLRITANAGGFNLNWIKFDIISSSEEEKYLPKEFSLEQNYPNPFNPSTIIQYSIGVVETLHATSLHTELIIYDILGREIATIINEQQRPGEYSVTFDASGLAGGVYIYTLKAGNYTKSRKMIFIK